MSYFIKIGKQWLECPRPNDQLDNITVNHNGTPKDVWIRVPDLWEFTFENYSDGGEYFSVNLETGVVSGKWNYKGGEGRFTVPSLGVNYYTSGHTTWPADPKLILPNVRLWGPLVKLRKIRGPGDGDIQARWNPPILNLEGQSWGNGWSGHKAAWVWDKLV